MPIVRDTRAQKRSNLREEPKNAQSRIARIDDYWSYVAGVTQTASLPKRKRNACARSCSSKQPMLSEEALLSGRGASASVRRRRRCARHRTSGRSRQAGQKRSPRKWRATGTSLSERLWRPNAPRTRSTRRPRPRWRRCAPSIWRMSRWLLSARPLPRAGPGARTACAFPCSTSRCVFPPSLRNVLREASRQRKTGPSTDPRSAAT